MATETNHINADYSLGNVLSDFLSYLDGEKKNICEGTLLHAIIDIYNEAASSDVKSSSVLKFLIDDLSTNNAICQLKKEIDKKLSSNIDPLNNPLTYLLDELICNIQQHAQTDAGYAYVGYNDVVNSIEIVVADKGVSIYGSYVAAQKHVEQLDNSDASALNLAQNGYSVKNLPNAENRGYGISSNMRMVVEGLHGEFAIFSGNALLVSNINRKEIMSLPQILDFKGTMVVARFPAILPTDFDFYHYIS